MRIRHPSGISIIAPEVGGLHRYVQDLARFLSGVRVLGLDIETTGLEVDAALRLVQIASPTVAWVFDVSDPVQRAVTSALFRDISRRWVSHTSIDPWMVYRHLGVNIAPRALDSWTNARILDPSDLNRRDLKHLTTEHLDPHLRDAQLALEVRFAELKGPRPRKPAAPAKSKSARAVAQARYLERVARYQVAVSAWEREVDEWDSFVGWRDIPTTDEVYITYSGLDAAYALRLFYLQLDQLQDLGIPPATIVDEQRFYQICTGMRIRGQAVDTDYARDVALGDHLESYDRSRQEFEALTGFVSGSPRFAEWLIERAVPLQDKTETGAWSLAKEPLQRAYSRYLSAPDPDPDAVRALELKEAVSASSNYVTFTQNLLARVDPLDGRIHPIYKGLGAETGRMSATDPAVQTMKGLTRGIILPYGDDQVLVSIDMSQIEPRIAGARSQEEALLAVFHAGEDLYDRFARMIWGDDFTKRQRSAIKRVILATLYAGGVDVIITQLRQLDGIIMSPAEVTKIRSRFRQLAPGLGRYARRLEREPEIWLDSGRFVPVPDGREWKNINSDIQGTARDVLRDAVFRIQEAGYEDRLVNLIHDEAVLSLDRATLDHDVVTIQACFGVPYLGVPVVTEVEVYEDGRWGAGKRIWRPVAA